MHPEALPEYYSHSIQKSFSQSRTHGFGINEGRLGSKYGREGTLCQFPDPGCTNLVSAAEETSLD